MGIKPNTSLHTKLSFFRPKKSLLFKFTLHLSARHWPCLFIMIFAALQAVVCVELKSQDQIMND